MDRKHIDISSQHKLKSGEFVQWVHTVPAHNFVFHQVNGVTIATVERTYYLDQKTNKIRYYGHNCDNASYNHMYTFFSEVYPGIFAFHGVTSEDHLTGKIEKCAESVKTLQAGTVEQFRNSLVRY